MALSGALAIVAIASAACDIEDTQHEQQTVGPALAVLSSNIDGTGAVIPADGVIQLAFDRYLLPATIKRQSFALLDSNRAPIGIDPIKTIYDPIARTVTITGPEGPGRPWLIPDQTYRLLLLVPPDGQTDDRGFRAIDRATLPAERELVFRAGPATGQAQLQPAVDFCGDVLPLLAMKCGDAICHGVSEKPAASLILRSAEGIRVTALNRVAQGANTGPRSYSPAPTARHFGLDMAIIQPGDPGASWLMYKIDLARLPVIDAGPPPAFACTAPDGTTTAASTGTYEPLVPAFQPSASEAERATLNDYVLGREMPYPYKPEVYQPPSGYYFTALTFQERERIRIWIANGANVRECGACDTTE